MARRTRRRRGTRRFAEVTKKDFVRIAEILKRNGACKVAVDLAGYFATQNPNFKPVTFLRAVGCSR